MNIQELKELLEKLGKSTTLDLGYNNIGAEGGKLIAKALEKNTTLTTLDLSGNKIGDDGAKLIAKALEKNKTLTTLGLSGNKIGAEGAKLIAKALEKNKTLTTLNLNFNEIGAEGAKLIAKALEGNRTLLKDLAKLLVKNFDQEKNDKIKIPLKYLKLYQVCDKELLKEYIDNDKKFDSCTKKANEYIAENFTKILGISKSGDLITNDTDIAKSPFAVKELSANISSFLPKILWDIKLGKSFYNLKEKVDSYLKNLKQTNLKEVKEIKTIFSEKSKDKSDIVTVKKLLALHDKSLDTIVEEYCKGMEIDVTTISGENNQFDNVNDL
jgi:hypothetical protein